MVKFKIGDRIKVNKYPFESHFHERCGIIYKDIRSLLGDYVYEVKLDNVKGSLFFKEVELNFENETIELDSVFRWLNGEI
jgi:hypothetical protein